MENLKQSLEKDKQYLFKCSQCNKMIDLSGKIFFCKNCNSNFCDDCLKVHNEIFFGHDISKTNEDLAYSLKDERNSLLANPDLDLDDRGIIDNKLPHLTNKENEDKYSQLTMLFHDTLTSIQENFNEEICKLKAKKTKEKNDKENENQIIGNDLNINIDKLKELPPMERLQKIMENISQNK